MFCDAQCCSCADRDRPGSLGVCLFTTARNVLSRGTAMRGVGFYGHRGCRKIARVLSIGEQEDGTLIIYIALRKISYYSRQIRRCGNRVASYTVVRNAARNKRLFRWVTTSMRSCKYWYCKCAFFPGDSPVDCKWIMRFGITRYPWHHYWRSMRISKNRDIVLWDRGLHGKNISSHSNNWFRPFLFKNCPATKHANMI